MPSVTKPVVVRPKAYLKVRQKAVRQGLRELKLDSILLTHPPDLWYLSNFTGDDSVGLLTDKDLYLFTDFRYREQAEIEAGWVKLVIREGRMEDALLKGLLETRPGRIGFEANFTTVGQIDALQRRIARHNEEKPSERLEVELVPLQDVMVNIRKVKDDNEIDLIRKAVGVAEEAFEAVLPEIKVGEKENYVAGLLEFEMRCRGASQGSFPVIVAAGPNSSLPHYRAGEATIQRDQPVLVDWGAVYRGYCSDLTRTFLIGRVSPRLKQAYKVVLEAQLAAIEFLRPGVTTMQADRVARDVIEKAGFGEHFGHGLGHGIGREIHELPTMRKTGGEEEVRPGMVVTVEPGIYLPGEGGVRIEDDVLITHSGCEVLSSLEKSFEACHLE